MNEDLEYFIRQFVIACRIGNTKRAKILKRRIILMNDALIIYKLPTRQTYKIDVGKLTDVTAKNFIKKITDKFRKRNR